MTKTIIYDGEAVFDVKIEADENIQEPLIFGEIAFLEDVGLDRVYDLLELKQYHTQFLELELLEKITMPNKLPGFRFTATGIRIC